MCLFKRHILICFRKTNFYWLLGWKNFFTNLFCHNKNSPKTLFPKHNFQQKKNNNNNGINRKGSPNILHYNMFNTTKSKFFSSQLNTKFPAKNWFTQFFFKQMFYYKNYLKQKSFLIRSPSHILSATMGGAVVSKCHKMDMNEYPNIFGCHIFQWTNIQIYLDATY